MRVAIFDLDETITRRPTFFRWVLFWVKREAPWRIPLLPFAALATLAYAFGLIGRAQLKSLSATIAMGSCVERGRVERMAEAFAAAELQGNVRADAVKRIAAERELGARVVLASASFEIYVAAFARALGAADALGTPMVERADGALTPRVAGKNCYGPEKLRRVEAWFAANAMARKDVRVAAYSDHLSDEPLLAFADEAVAVCPSAGLQSLARTRGWKVERWR